METVHEHISELRNVLYLPSLSVVFILILGWNLIHYARNALKPGLRSIPGPFLARFTRLWRLFQISKGGGRELYQRLHDRYGPIVRTAPNVVSISDPQAIPIIYGINSKFVKSAFYDPFNVFYKGTILPSLFSVRDPVEHQEMRRSVAQKYTMSSMKSMEPFADDCTDIFLEAMKDLEGQPIDLGVWLQWYAFDVIASITFHRRFGFMEQRRDIQNMIHDIGVALRTAAVIGQIPEWHPWLLGNKWVAKFLAAQPLVAIPDPFRTFTDECIDDYDQNPPSTDRPDFLAWLRIEAAKGKPFTHRDMINHLSDNLLAGSDTTGIGLRAVFYFLIQNRDCYERAKAEIDEADRDGLLSKHITYAQCLELSYLQAVIKESMRCHPGIAFPLERIVPKGGTDVCGVHLDAGTIVGINPAVIHNDKTIFGDDAAAFNPDRWLRSDVEHVKRMERHILTFGYGSRTCIGKNISYMEMGKLAPQVLRYFDLEWASNKPTWEVKTYWMSKQHGLIFRLKSRIKE